MRGWLVLLVLGCRREHAAAVDAAPSSSSSPSSSSTPSPASPELARLEDHCKRHEDCVAVDLFTDGPLRCCIACGARAAASKTSADGFIAACVKERPTRECPIYDCKAELLDPRCVGGHCQLAPRPR